MYADEGISGCSTDKREAFKAMVQDALDGKIDLILANIKTRYLIQRKFFKKLCITIDNYTCENYNVFIVDSYS